jgi:hypothetical protein
MVVPLVLTGSICARFFLLRCFSWDLRRALLAKVLNFIIRRVSTENKDSDAFNHYNLNRPVKLHWGNEITLVTMLAGLTSFLIAILSLHNWVRGGGRGHAVCLVRPPAPPGRKMLRCVVKHLPVLCVRRVTFEYHRTFSTGRSASHTLQAPPVNLFRIPPSRNFTSNADVVDFDPALAKKMIDEENGILIDCRTEAEFNSGAPLPAVHFPFDEITARLNEVCTFWINSSRPTL